MTAEAAKLWEEFAARHEASEDPRPVDAFVVAAFCEAMAAANRVRAGLRAPIVDDGKGRVKVSPAFAAWQQGVATALKFAEHLGWTPLARSRLRVDDQLDAPADGGTGGLYGSASG